MLTRKCDWIITLTLLIMLAACHSRYYHTPAPQNIQKSKINCLKNSNTTRNAIQFLEFRRNQQLPPKIKKPTVVVDQVLLHSELCPQLRATITALINVAHANHIAVIISKKTVTMPPKTNVLLHLTAQGPTHETAPTFVITFPS